MKELLQCAQTSKRLRDICHDSLLWTSPTRLNLYFTTVPCELIKYILDKRSCKYLSLWSAELLGNFNLCETTKQLKYLDLNFCKANDGVLSELISSCQSLEKLSMKNLTLNGKLIDRIR